MAVSPKLSTSEVYNQIRSLMCSINTPVGESSGFLMKDKVVVTVAHNILFAQPSLAQISYHSNPEKPSFPLPLQDINHESAKAVDLFAFKTDIPCSNPLPLLPDGIKLYEGMKVYFAGFPLGSEKITFHKGRISSVNTDEGVEEFTIDGTVVPGNSGGPVVALHNGAPHLIGVITSELADISLEDRKTIEIVQKLQLYLQQVPEDSVMTAGPISLSNKGTAIEIIINNPFTGKEEKLKIYDRETSVMALDLIQRNLSTGIGKAVDIRMYKKLFDKASSKREASTYYFPTKGKGVVQGSIENKITKVEILKYMEVRYGVKKGPRGIRTVMSDGSGMHTYKFSPNPHTGSSKDYNKDQKTLYLQAGIALGNIYLSTNAIPPSFTFEAYEVTYKATKES